MHSLRAEIESLMIDAVDVRTVARGELKTIQDHLAAIRAACSGDANLMRMIDDTQHQVIEAEDAIGGQVDYLSQDLEQFMGRTGNMKAVSRA